MRQAAIALLLAWAGAVAAQDTEELQRQLRDRDARIRELTERLESLEKKAEPDDDLLRALERTLVLQGALMLRPRTYEVEPQFVYERWDKDRPPLRYRSEAAVTARAGLAWDSQVQIRVPYAHVSTLGDSASGLGDVDVALSHQLARESGYWPGLVASIAWLSRTGSDGLDGRVPTGGGFNVLQAGITASKRQDPLVHYATVAYADARARRIEGAYVDPGNTLGFRLGTILAASPGSSLTLGVNLAFVDSARVDGQSVPGTDTVSGTLQIGLGTVLSKSAMLSLGGEFRFSGNVPNFRLSLALPIRF